MALRVNVIFALNDCTAGAFIVTVCLAIALKKPGSSSHLILMARVGAVINTCGIMGGTMDMIAIKELTGTEREMAFLEPTPVCSIGNGWEDMIMLAIMASNVVNIILKVEFLWLGCQI